MYVYNILLTQYIGLLDEYIKKYKPTQDNPAINLKVSLMNVRQNPQSIITITKAHNQTVTFENFILHLSRLLSQAEQRQDKSSSQASYTIAFFSSAEHEYNKLLKIFCTMLQVVGVIAAIAPLSNSNNYLDNQDPGIVASGYLCQYILGESLQKHINRLNSNTSFFSSVIQTNEELKERRKELALLTIRKIKKIEHKSDIDYLDQILTYISAAITQNNKLTTDFFPGSSMFVSSVLGETLAIILQKLCLFPKYKELEVTQKEALLTNVMQAVTKQNNMLLQYNKKTNFPSEPQATFLVPLSEAVLSII